MTKEKTVDRISSFFRDSRGVFNIGTVIALLSFFMLCYIVVKDKNPTPYVVLPFTLIVISYFVADTAIARIMAKGEGGGFQHPDTVISTENTEVSSENITINPLSPPVEQSAE